MSIQLSVVLWAIICFIVLMLILKYMLFNPLLSVMDEREKRVALARSAAEELNSMQKQREEQLKQEQKQKYDQALLTAEQEYNSAVAAAEEKISAEHTKKQHIVAEYSEALRAEHEGISAELGDKAEELAVIFVEDFLSRV